MFMFAEKQAAKFWKNIVKDLHIVSCVLCKWKQQRFSIYY